jgi:hypothetical protein
MTKAVDGLTGRARGLLWSHNSEESAEAPASGVLEDNDEFRVTRLDTGDGPEAIMIVFK